MKGILDEKMRLLNKIYQFENIQLASANKINIAQTTKQKEAGYINLEDPNYRLKQYFHYNSREGIKEMQMKNEALLT